MPRVMVDAPYTGADVREDTFPTVGDPSATWSSSEAHCPERPDRSSPTSVRSETAGCDNGGVTSHDRPELIPDDDIERWLYCSGLVAPSVDSLRPDFPRWRQQLLARGVTRIPSSPWSADDCDTLAANMLSLFVRQASSERNAGIEHNLRDLAGVRPYKG
jgi:hypothetical protein